MPDFSPCPYHQTKKAICPHNDICPLLDFGAYAICNKLSDADIKRVKQRIEP